LYGELPFGAQPSVPASLLPPLLLLPVMPLLLLLVPLLLLVVPLLLLVVPLLLPLAVVWSGIPLSTVGVPPLSSPQAAAVAAVAAARRATAVTFSKALWAFIS
jgi:hypothetical protein